MLSWILSLERERGGRPLQVYPLLSSRRLSGYRTAPQQSWESPEGCSAWSCSAKYPLADSTVHGSEWSCSACRSPVLPHMLNSDDFQMHQSVFACHQSHMHRGLFVPWCSSQYLGNDWAWLSPPVQRCCLIGQFFVKSLEASSGLKELLLTTHLLALNSD